MSIRGLSPLEKAFFSLYDSMEQIGKESKTITNNYIGCVRFSVHGGHLEIPQIAFK